MKAKFISKLLVLPFLFLGMGLTYGQTNENKAKEEKVIRVKMVKNINGVESVFDTTIVGGEWNDIHSQMHNMPEIEIIMDSIHHGQGGNPHIMVKTIDLEGIHGSLDSNVTIQVIHGDNTDLEKLMRERHLDMDDAEFQKLLKEHGIDPGKGDGNMEKRVIIIDDEDINKDGVKGGDHQMKIKVVVKTCNIEDLDKEDRKRLKNEERSFNEKLKVDQVNFYPNPNNGRFNLGFTLEKQGDTEISIFDMNGKNVYSEKLSGFTGSYQKEIDISNNATGVYYIKVTQGKDSFFKKMIMQ
jgi:hypothetical protein